MIRLTMTIILWIIMAFLNLHIMTSSHQVMKSVIILCPKPSLVNVLLLLHAIIDILNSNWEPDYDSIMNESLQCRKSNMLCNAIFFFSFGCIIPFGAWQCGILEYFLRPIPPTSALYTVLFILFSWIIHCIFQSIYMHTILENRSICFYTDDIMFRLELFL